MPNSRTEVLDKDELRALVAETLDVPAGDLGDHTTFIDDLGVDSLSALEVVVVLEKRYGIRLTEAELRRVTTLQTAYDVLRDKVDG